MSAPLKDLDGQYTNPNIDYLPPGNDQDNLVASGPSHMEYHSQSAYVRSLSLLVTRSIDGVSDYARTAGNARRWC